MSLLSSGLHFHKTLIEEWYYKLFPPSFPTHRLETLIKIHEADSGRRHIYQYWHIVSFECPDAINSTTLLRCFYNSSWNYNFNLKAIKMRCYIAEHKTHSVKYTTKNTRALYLNRKFHYLEMPRSVSENYLRIMFSIWELSENRLINRQ